MNRRKFALSWGRKLFFGLSWPLTTILSLIYLRSFILPASNIEWLYFSASYIGHFGVLTTAIYFLFYAPIVLLMPSYYVARFWSLTLIVGLNVFILLDAISFSSYHLHIYSYLSTLYLKEGFNYLLDPSILKIIVPVGTIIFSVLIWIRGEMLWRHMQARFSNPVKNWYLGIIFISLIVSHSLSYFSRIHPKLTELFPFNQRFSKYEKQVFQDSRKFFYPKDSLKCEGRNNPNIILIVVDEWSSSQFTSDSMPVVSHMKKHAMNFNLHYGTGVDIETGLFSLLYSVPASYMASVGESVPAIFRELQERKYEKISFKYDEGTVKIKNWILQRVKDETRPYFLSVQLEKFSPKTDKSISDIILALGKDKVTDGAYIVVTAAHAGDESSLVPYLVATPERKFRDISNITSHYDVMPSLMESAWGCKRSFKMASIGQPQAQPRRDWLLIAGKDSFKIIDFLNNNVSYVKDGEITDKPLSSEKKSSRHELIFSAIKSMTSLSRPR